MHRHLYVQTNEQKNRVIAFRRAADGALAPGGSYETGGGGDGVPHLTSQGSVVLSGDGRFLLATNAATDDISVFAVAGEGLKLLQQRPVGRAPKSVAEHGGIVYVLSQGEPGVTGFRLTEAGLEPISGSHRALSSPQADPAQVGFGPGGTALIVTERGVDAITVFPVGVDGLPGEPRTLRSSGPTPYGFACTSSGVLVVTEAFRGEKGAAAASSYRLSGGALKPVTTSLRNGRTAMCWAVTTRDGRHAFTTNFRDGAVSRYAIDATGALTLEAAAASVSVDGKSGLRDAVVTPDERFFYVIDADGGRIHGWAVGEDRELSPIGSSDGVPSTVAGLAAN